MLRFALCPFSVMTRLGLRVVLRSERSTDSTRLLLVVLLKCEANDCPATFTGNHWGHW
jgi:hypothetical protein